MTSVSMTTVTDPSSVNTESAGVEDAESSQGGKPTQLEPDHDLTAEEEALLAILSLLFSFRVKHNLWSLCFRAFPGRRALGLNPVASTAA